MGKLKVLIITVAGMATRFNKDLDKPTLKCLYNEESIKESILYRLLEQSKLIEKIIIVGGYLFSDLIDNISNYFTEFIDKVELINNPHYSNYGSMYSLFLGIREAAKYHPDTIIFAEGDLLVDDDHLLRVISGNGDAITINREVIWADKSVVCYIKENNKIQYIYDTNHQIIEFKEGVKAIFNSAQIWRFANPEKVIKLNNSLSNRELEGTNLTLIQSYFQEIDFSEIETITFDLWVNCNTKEEYLSGLKKLKEYHNELKN